MDRSARREKSRRQDISVFEDLLKVGNNTSNIIIILRANLLEVYEFRTYNTLVNSDKNLPLLKPVT